MIFFLTKGLTQTAPFWLDVEQGYAWVHRAAHLLANDEKQTAGQVRQSYEDLLAKMEQASTSSETLTTMLATFRKVTASYWAWPLSLLRPGGSATHQQCIRAVFWLSSLS